MVIPVRAEDVTPSEDFTYELATRQWIDMFIDWETAIEKLTQQVETAIPRAENGQMAAMRRPLVTKKTNLPLFVGMAAVLLVGGAAGFWLTRQPAPSVAAAPPPSRGIERQEAAPPSASLDSAKAEADLWDSVKASNNASVVGSYLAKYPRGTFGAAAKARLAELNNRIRAVRVSPSFSCAAAVNQVERVICADPGLSAMDAQTALLYRRARENASNTSALADEQSAWLYRRNRCADAGCIRESYAERRAEIGRWLESGDL